jgi:hypothetical protein
MTEAWASVLMAGSHHALMAVGKGAAATSDAIVISAQVCMMHIIFHTKHIYTIIIAIL